MSVMMKCGHAANAESAGMAACAICACFEVAPSAPNLEGRMAKCAYAKRRDGKPCLSEKPSSPELAFFEHRPDEPHDRYYCGCWGWD